MTARASPPAEPSEARSDNVANTSNRIAPASAHHITARPGPLGREPNSTSSTPP